jgi:hypothetical protein
VITCPHCGAANKPESRFCGECGQPLGVPQGVTCPMCDTPNPPGVSVCTKCGAQLMPPGVSPTDVPLEAGESGEEVAGAKAEREVPTEPAGDLTGLEKTETGIGATEQVSGEVVPPWLKKLEGLPSEEVSAELEEEERRGTGDLPEWLEVPPDFEEILAEASAAESEEEVAPGEIPPWLKALRPGEEEGGEEETVARGIAEATGLLKGIRGTLGIEPVVAIPRRAVPLPVAEPSSVGYERAELFEAVVRESARPAVEVAPRGRAETLMASTVRWIIYFILIAGVAVPLLLGSRWSEANMPANPSTTAMYEAIEALPADSVVLISHDYDPGAAGEMIPQVEAVLHHLMERQVRLINVSLTPEGARLARQVVEQVAEDHGYIYGEDHLNLGYVTGVEAAPRTIVEGLQSAEWSDFVGTGKDLSLIVEFAGTQEYLRLWLEQVQGPYGLPMVAGVSATADPYARPYYRNEARRQLAGLMTGLVGAAEYERHSGEAGLALASMDSQSVVHVAIVLLILVGNVAYFGGRLRGKPS